jgi:1,4-dihydroxy-2-naphthoate octaprenyltransferase
MNIKQLNAIMVLSLIVLFVFFFLTQNWLMIGVIIILYIVYAIWYEGVK